MEYWRGYMDWPVDPDWVCETCGGRVLIWGLVHGVCRCDTCHTQYHMRPDGEIVMVPVCRLKPEYKASAKAGWREYHKPISEWTDEMWDRAFSLVPQEVPA